MGNSNIKAFRKDNSLKQEDLAKFLGVSRSFISQVESGFCGLPEEKLQTLLANKYNWDTTALVTPNITQVTGDKNEVNVNSKNKYTYGSLPTSGIAIQDDETNRELAKVRMEIELLKQENQMLKAQLKKAEDLAERYWTMLESKMK